jgi:CRISPR-associated protein Csx10
VNTFFLKYKITLRAPTILTTISGDPNSAETLDYIPGSALRGVVASKLMKLNVNTESSSFMTLINSDKIRYLNAYPVVDSTRALPTPVSWRSIKGQETGLTYDLSAFIKDSRRDAEFYRNEDDEIATNPDNFWPSEQLDRKLPGFIAFLGDKRVGVRSLLKTRTHQQRDRNKGRAYKDQKTQKTYGAIYNYEYLEPNQTFMGLIQVINLPEADYNEVIQVLRTCLESGPIFIGRSRNAGYGGMVEFSFENDIGKQLKTEEASWNGIRDSGLTPGEQFQVYLLSPCIVRNQTTGQIDPNALPQTLIARFGGEKCVARNGVGTFWEFSVVGGFNRKWRLEIPQTLSVSAGSVIELTASGNITIETLQEIVKNGIGERLNEGFGRFVVLKKSMLKSFVLDEHIKTPVEIKIDDIEEDTETEFLQSRIFDFEVRKSITGNVIEIVNSAERFPPNSLIGRLRIPLRNTDPEEALATIRIWLSNPREVDAALRKEAQDKLQRCTLGNHGSLHCFLQDVSNPNYGHNLLNEEIKRKYALIQGSEKLMNRVARARGPKWAVLFIDELLSRLSLKGKTNQGELA